MKKIKRKGITLIELVITMGLVVIILGVVTVVFTSNSKIMNKVDVKSELQLQGELIQRQLMMILPESKGIIEINYKSEDSPEIKSFIADDEMFWHQYLIENEKLSYQKIDKSTNNVVNETDLSTYVKSLIIEPENKAQVLSSKKIVLKINLVKVEGGKVGEYQIDQSVVFRNF